MDTSVSAPQLHRWIASNINPWTRPVTAANATFGLNGIVRHHQRICLRRGGSSMAVGSPAMSALQHEPDLLCSAAARAETDPVWGPQNRRSVQPRGAQQLWSQNEGLVAHIERLPHSFASSATSAWACSAGACSVGMRTKVCGRAAAASASFCGFGSLAAKGWQLDDFPRHATTAGWGGVLTRGHVDRTQDVVPVAHDKSDRC